MSGVRLTKSKLLRQNLIDNFLGKIHLASVELDQISLHIKHLDLECETFRRFPIERFLNSMFILGSCYSYRKIMVYVKNVLERIILLLIRTRAFIIEVHFSRMDCGMLESDLRRIYSRILTKASSSKFA